MLKIEDSGVFEDYDVDRFSKFNIEAINSVDATSPVWSKTLKMIFAAGSIAAAFM